MSCKLKIAGLALFAAFALSAVAASAASAHFTSGSDSTRLTAEGVSASQKFEVNASEYVTCEHIAMAGTVTIGTNEEIIEMEPVYTGNCKVVQGSTQVLGTIDANGCKYRFTTTGEIHIVCPSEKHILVTATSLHLPCYDIPGQTPTVPNASYTNEGSGSTMGIRFTSKVEAITYEKTEACGSGEANNMRYIGEITVTGENPTTQAHIEVTKS